MKRSTLTGVGGVLGARHDRRGGPRGSVRPRRGPVGPRGAPAVVERGATAARPRSARTHTQWGHTWIGKPGLGGLSF